MGGFYSFRVFAPHEVIIHENFVALDEGMNTFNCHVNDIDHFVDRLKSEDVRIDVMIHLDAPSIAPPEHLLGE
jgi:hypothetical protein